MVNKKNPSRAIMIGDDRIIRRYFNGLWQQLGCRGVDGSIVTVPVLTGGWWLLANFCSSSLSTGGSPPRLQPTGGMESLRRVRERVNHLRGNLITDLNGMTSTGAPRPSSGASRISRTISHGVSCPEMSCAIAELHAAEQIQEHQAAFAALMKRKSEALNAADDKKALAEAAAEATAEAEAAALTRTDDDVRGESTENPLNNPPHDVSGIANAITALSRRFVFLMEGDRHFWPEGVKEAWASHFFPKGKNIQRRALSGIHRFHRAEFSHKGRRRHTL